MTHHLTDLGSVVRKMRPLLKRLVGEEIELRYRGTSAKHAVPVAHADLEQILTELAVCGRDAGGGVIAVETKVEDDETPRGKDAVPPGRYVVLSLSCSLDAPRSQSQPERPPWDASTLREIVDACHAHLIVKDEEGPSPRFEVYFPEAGLAPSRRARAAERGATETILLAEDEDPVRDLAKMILERQGYRVLEARNGAEALRVSQAHEGPIHLILADVVMPKLGGPEAVERLRRTRPETRVLFLSGYSTNVVATKDDRAFGRAYLRKPFTVDSLAQKVREVLDEKSDPPTV